ncbi:hypothetical protein PanWU01x14_226580 [Parasponia andersonii]|uniref:Uncharacterized protein n=1 Tax=Parasponia andersonii TaxID=3476 RepID=A0A2P5BMI9_PARAD|nr:hypothetical protein PanWU01x14_226580 [Parasponia andersonii]
MFPISTKISPMILHINQKQPVDLLCTLPLDPLTRTFQTLQALIGLLFPQARQTLVDSVASVTLHNKQLARTNRWSFNFQFVSIFTCYGS